MTIEDNDDLNALSRRRGHQIDFGEVEDLPLEESDADEGPLVVNAHEFIPEKRVEREPQRRSLTPPRRTVQTDDTGDDVVYRDKSGKRITREQWLLLQGKKKITSKRSEPAQELEWGKGIVQKLDSEAKALEERKLAQEPLNRYDIDADYDKQLQTQQRWDDPMSRKQARSTVGDVPKSRFTGVPNRFNIEPGYRWDGVIRGNGYEDRWFKVQASKAAKQQEYYLNNIADM